jgi:hypothetical protein
MTRPWNARVCAALLVSCAACASRAPDAFAPPGPWTGNVAVLIGGRAFDESVWEPVEDQVAVGLEADFRPARSPLGIEVGVQGSNGYDSGSFGVDIDASSGELYAGPRLTLDAGGVHPYAGAGVTFLAVDVEGFSGNVFVRDDDAAIGAYAHAGLYVNVTHAFNIGFDVRAVFGTDVDLFGADSDADYVQGALLLGARW